MHSISRRRLSSVDGSGEKRVEKGKLATNKTKNATGTVEGWFVGGKQPLAQGSDGAKPQSIL